MKKGICLEFGDQRGILLIETRVEEAKAVEVIPPGFVAVPIVFNLSGDYLYTLDVNITGLDIGIPEQFSYWRVDSTQFNPITGPNYYNATNSLNYVNLSEPVEITYYDPVFNNYTQSAGLANDIFTYQVVNPIQVTTQTFAYANANLVRLAIPIWGVQFSNFDLRSSAIPVVIRCDSNYWHGHRSQQWPD